MAYGYSERYSDTLGQRPLDTERDNLRKHGILNRFDTLSYFGHNFLVWTPIEVIEIGMKSKRNTYKFHVFNFLRYDLYQGQNRPVRE